MKGIDISSNQHPANKPIDWFKVADAGYGFAIVKATQGMSYVNPWLVTDLEDARAAGLFVGAYHYFEAGDDAVVQAKHFTSQLMGQVLDLGAWLDWEPPEMQAWMVKSTFDGFLAEAKTARPGCGAYYDLAWATQLREAMVDGHRTWLASWGDVQPSGCMLWQDSGNATVDGVPAPVDTDVMVSSRSFNLPSSPPPRPSAATAVSMVPVGPEPTSPEAEPSDATPE